MSLLAIVHQSELCQEIGAGSWKLEGIQADPHQSACRAMYSTCCLISQNCKLFTTGFHLLCSLNYRWATACFIADRSFLLRAKRSINSLQKKRFQLQAWVGPSVTMAERAQRTATYKNMQHGFHCILWISRLMISKMLTLDEQQISNMD